MKHSFISGLILALGFSPARAIELQDLQQIFKTFRERQAFEHRAAQHDQETLRAHMDQVNDLRATLALPKDQATDRDLEQALANDQKALVKARERLRLAEHALRGEFLGIPYEVSGLVEKRMGLQWEPIARTTPVLCGDVLQTQAAGRIRLIFEDGSHIVMLPNSSFRLKDETASEVIYELLQGSVQVDHRPNAIAGVLRQVTYRTPSALAVLNGTRFGLSLDESKRTRLVLTTGKIHLTSISIDQEPGRKPWWTPTTSMDTHPLIYGKWIRLIKTEGRVTILRPDGIGRKAVVGAELSPSERLETGDNGLAWGFLKSGYLVALKPGSLLVGPQKGKLPEAQFQKGTFHVTSLRKDDRSDSRWTFQTPSNFCSTAHSEFEISVDAESRQSDWVPYNGTLELTAR